MKKAALLFLIPGALSAAFNYYYSETTNDPSKWTSNGDFTTATGGSKISNIAAPDGNSYEIKTTLSIKASGGTFVTYLRATSDALNSPTTANGSYYAIELQDVTVSGGTCSATLAIYKTIAGSVQSLASMPFPCKDGMVFRITRNGSWFFMWSDLGLIYYVIDNDIASGQPGFGARNLNTSAGNGFAKVELGPFDQSPITPVNTASIATSVAGYEVDLQWQSALSQVGICGYQTYRDGVFMGGTTVGPTLVDHTVSPNTAYQYIISAVACQGGQLGSAPFTVHTPSPAAIDPRRTGVRTTGTYWGRNGEQIDLLSGNLNFTLPLIRAQGRGGWGVTFALNYNSANFRKDTAATWKLGRDSGYGFGWKFLAGSLTPYYSDWLQVHHYQFTDSTGAEYRLDQQANGIWYSRESVYVRYDPVKKQLYFPDGSFWEFGAEAAGLEEDSGTRYPTKMQDTNGNFIAISYQTGAYALDPQSSSRITFIEDSRALNCTASTLCTYWLTYTADATPHLTSVNGISSVGVNYTFSMTQNLALNSPFTSDATTFGTTTRLDTITGAYGLQHQFTYNTNNSGELTKVRFPYGGSLGWQFRDFAFSDNRVIRDMQIRTLNDGINGDLQYYFYHDDTRDYNTSNHSDTYISDASGTAIKHWAFDNATGLQGILYEHSLPGWGYMRTTNTYWATDSDGNRYISQSFVTIDPGQATQQTARTDQVRDNFGNLVQMQVYDYNNTSTPARIYNNTYITDSNYTSRYIRNLLSTSTVTPAGGSPITLAINSYDFYNGNSCAQTSNGQNASPPDNANEFDVTYNGNGATYRGNVCAASAIGSFRRMTYNRAGAVLQTQDALGHTVTATPDAGHNYAVPAAITTGNLTSTMTWNGAFQPTGSTNPNGATTSLAYDAYARPAASTSPYGAATSVVYSNSPATRVTTTDTNTTGTVNNYTYNKRWTRETLDGFGRTVKVETGYTSTTGSTTSSPVISGQSETEYAPCGCTPMGKPKRTSQTHAPGATIYWTTYTYDSLGRTVAVSQPNNLGQTTYAYSGNTVTVTDAAGKWKTFTTDAMGNLTQVSEPNPAGGANFLTYYTYNTFNQLLTVSMTRPKVPANGTNVTQTRTFVYDSNQRVQSVTNPENGTTSYTYNADGTMNTKTDAKGQVLSYFYDSLGRLTQVKSGGAVLRTFTYDANGWGQNLAGRVARVDYGGGKWSELYSYHPAGGRTAKRLSYTYNAVTSQSTQTLDAFWSYNTAGQVTSVKYPDTTMLDYFATPQVVTGDTFTYSYDPMGRPKDLTIIPGDGSTPYQAAQGATYGPAGELTSLSYLGLYEGRSYNARMQLTGISAMNSVGFVASLSYNYYDVAAGQQPDPTKNNGKVGQMSSTILGSTEVVNYKYDSLNRLIAAYTNDTSSAGWGLAWDYDGFGNRLSQTVTQGTAQPMTTGVDQATNRIGGTYDANGNMTNGGAFSYDVENRMIGASNLYVSSDEYDYAPDNKRIYKKTTNNSGTVEYVYFYSGSKKLATYQIGYYGSNNSQFLFMRSSTNIYFGGKLIQAEDAPVVTDRLGTVIWDQVKGGHKYFPYGEERTSTTNESTKFGTYFRDTTTGLDYAQERIYGNIVGRFLSADPYQASAGPQAPGSWNRYQYASGDPVGRSDPSGRLDCEGECWDDSEDDVDDLPESHPSTNKNYLNYLQAFDKKMKNTAAKAVLTMTTGCQRYFQDWGDLGSGVSKLADEAMRDTWTNAQVDGVRDADIHKYIVDAPGGVVPVWEWMASNDAAAFVGSWRDPKSWDVYLTKNVFIGYRFWEYLTKEQQNAVLVHEVLHTYTNRDDIGLASTLGLGSFKNGADASKAINDFLLTDCQKKAAQ